MKTWRMAAVSVLAALTGCIDSSTLVCVNKDGSGTIVVDEFYSAQMLEGMGGMMQGMSKSMGGATGEATGGDQVKADAPKVDFIEEAIKGKAQKLGTDVQLVSKQAKTNTQGWKGFHATYSFKDVTALTLSPGSMDSGGESSGGKMSTSGSQTYTIRFKAGSPAVLEIVPGKEQKSETATKAPAAAADNPKGTAQGEGDAEKPEAKQAQAMMEMMIPMLKGMRTVFSVKVDGTVVETNAKYKSEQDPSTFIIMDVPMDKVLADERVKKSMASGKQGNELDMAALSIPGVRVEDGKKTITIRFK